MGLLAGIFLAAGLVWTSLLLVYRPSIPGNWVSLGAIAAFFASVVCGYDFFHKDFGPLPLTIDRILLGITSVVAIGGVLLNRQRLPNLSGLDLCVLAWFGALTLSTFTTDFGYKDKLPVSRLLFYNFLPLVSYFLLRIYPLTSAQQRGLLWALVGLGLYLGLTGVAEWRHWYGFVFPKYIISPTFSEFLGRGRGPLLNPVINGMLLSLCGAAALLLLPLKPRRYWLPLLGAFGVIGLGVISTLTRSCWMGFAISTSMICLAPLGWRQRLVAIFLFGSLSFIVLASFSSQLNRFKRDDNVSVEDMSQSAALRPVLATVAWEMFQDRPLNGVGFAQYNKHKKPYHQVENRGLPLQIALPYVQHNVALAYLTELGLVGLLAAFSMWFAALRQGFQAWSQSKSSLESRCFGLLLLTAVINYLLNGMFHDVSIIPVANSSLLFAAALLNPSEFSAGVKAMTAFPATDSSIALPDGESLLARPS